MKGLLDMTAFGLGVSFVPLSIWLYIRWPDLTPALKDFLRAFLVGVVCAASVLAIAVVMWFFDMQNIWPHWDEGDR